ncbi:MAG: TIGR03013 family PEP-CTERM/XrtA system glycosyltransferase [Gemmatimonadetes bacterium]|nr:TIGR03013 family PEP-CTERM/XrtA system glycosyltransferase [Gemmatimonadota bacterium]
MKHIRILRQNIPVPVVLLALAEYGALVLAIYAAYTLRVIARGMPLTVEAFRLLDYTGVAANAHTYAVVNVLCMVALGAYRLRSNEGLSGMVLRALVAIFLLGTLVLTLEFFAIPELYFGRGILTIAAMISAVFIALLRVGYLRLRRTEWMRWRVMVVGAGSKAQRLASLVEREERGDVRLVGFFPVAAERREVDPARVLPTRGLHALAVELRVQEIVVAVDERRRSDSGGYPLDQLLDCKLAGFRVSEDISFLERETGRLDIRLLSSGWLVFSDGFSYSPLRDSLERAFDIAASLSLLLVTWPFMLLVALAIKLEDGVRAPLIYRQERVGYGGKTFRVHKFRSMRVDAEEDGKAVWAVRNDSRITRVGAVTRKLRIDELPQIVDVLRGDMSFVGPRPERPEIVEELARAIPYYNERHRVKPGITGWAQISYPYGASMEDAEEKLKYDLYYIKNHSLLFDLFILVRTVEIILLGEGAR